MMKGTEIEIKDVFSFFVISFFVRQKNSLVFDCGPQPRSECTPLSELKSTNLSDI
jgi:hypothetical protein